MTDSKRTTPPTYDRPSASVDRTTTQDTPWETAERRGTLDLQRDGSQNRRYHSDFEDMLNSARAVARPAKDHPQS